MKIEVKLVGRFKKYGQDKLDEENILELDEQATVSDLIDLLGIPPEQNKVVLVNGRDVKQDYQLSAGDRVSIYNLLAGG